MISRNVRLLSALSEWLAFAEFLIFEAATWAAFEKSAQAQGKSAQQLISTAIAASLGTMMMHNYALNHWLKNDNPDFFHQSAKEPGPRA